MPNHQKHRGQHSSDAKLFDATQIPLLQSATDDMCYLLGRGYAETAALKLVGDRYRLNERQRRAVFRSAGIPQHIARRTQKALSPSALGGQDIAIDGYNLLITTESMLAGGIIIIGRDGAFRDLASVHGTYKRVEETLPALHYIGEALCVLAPASLKWYLDSPIGNSGRLKVLMHQIAVAQGWQWEIELAQNPDKLLATQHNIVLTADAWILDQVPHWFNMAHYLHIHQGLSSDNIRYL